MLILAESFDALYVGAGGLLLLVMAMVSFIPSSRGHLAGPIIAAPSILSLLLVRVVASHDAVHPAYWLLCLLPLVLGFGSVALWKLRAPTRHD